jgi:MerR family transcriptional regulator, light-induced transcriptional regulator
MGISEWPGGSMDGLNWDGTLLDRARDAIAGRSAPDTSCDEERRLARLVRTIEGEIVPRLVMSRRVNVDAAVQQLRRCSMPDEIDVKEMVRLLLAHDASVASAYVAAVRQRGATLEMICLDLLAPTARELGLLWEEDECDFMQVTVGLCRLHQVLRELSPAFGFEDSHHESSKRILLAPFPGEQHTFGVTLVAQFLRRAGWEVWPEVPQTVAELLESMRENSFAAVGLSVGGETQLDAVAETIRTIRKSSRNRSVGVLIGGPIFVVKPGLAADMGADATGCDGRDAVRQAERVRSERWRRELGI